MFALDLCAITLHQPLIRGTRNITGNLRMTSYRGAFVQPSLSWKSRKYFILCVFVFVFVTLVIQHAKACAVYCRLWPVWLYHISSHHLTYGTILGKKLTNTKCVLILSTTSI